jgi:hypothetical protein
MELNLGYLQLHSGISTPVLEYNKNMEYVQNNWFTPVQHFLVQLNGILQIKGIWVPEKQRVTDIIIMDKAVTMDLSVLKLKQLNNWRLFFQANSLSDIATNEGDKIRMEVLQKKQIKQWPYQEAPDLSTFSVWSLTIKQISKCSNNGHLIQR